MERLTEIKTHVTGFSYTDKKEGIFAQNVYTKLAAYEDTGLSPEEIKAQQQEIKLLNMEIAELREQNQALKAYAENIEADKDEQAGRLMLLNDGIKQVIKWLTPHPSDGSRAVEKARLHLITLIGGKEDEK